MLLNKQLIFIPALCILSSAFVHATGCDINGDNVTNVSDVQMCVNQAIGVTACSTGDIDQNGTCNVVDVQRDVNAALGGSCGTTPPPTSCALPNYPTTACTGIPAGVTPHSCGTDATLSTNNQVVDGCIYTGNVTVTGNNVTIKNSRIYGTVWNNNGQTFTIQDSEIGPPTGCNGQTALGFENYTATRLYIHNFSDGPRDSGSNILVQDSFITICSNAGDHSDGFQGYLGGKNVTVSHNTIDLRQATSQNAAIFFADSSQSGTVLNNLLAAGGYTLRVHDDADPDIGPWVITGNRIVDGAWQYGPVLTTNTDCNASTMSWSDNRLVTIDANYKILTTGATVGCGG